MFTKSTSPIPVTLCHDDIRVSTEISDIAFHPLQGNFHIQNAQIG